MTKVIAGVREPYSSVGDVLSDPGGALETINELIGALESARLTLDAVRTARSNHPECDRHDEDGPVTCGWKRAVLDIDAALTGAAQ